MKNKTIVFSKKVNKGRKIGIYRVNKILMKIQEEMKAHPTLR